MCNSRIKSGHAMIGVAAVAEIDGRPVLQPAPNAANRVATSEAGRPLKKKTLQKSISLSTPPKLSAPVSPTSKPAKPELNTSSDNLVVPKPSAKPASATMKRSKSCVGGSQVMPSSLESSTLLSCDWAPGSIAAALREQAMLMQAQRKMRISHYGRTPAKLEGKVVPVDTSLSVASAQEEKRCSFITPNADPVYVAYHDEEWGVPVHDDRMLFELLVLAGAQVGLDWTAILKKRNDFRDAFAEFDAELVSKFTERQMASISASCGLDLGRVRGVVDDAKRILEVRREFGSLDKYLWGIINHKSLAPLYKSCRKIPVKTSKSEFISKDMVRRGFRFVGPTVVHSFMQAAGLTNDHLVSCPRHLHCSSLSSSTTTN